MQEHGATDGPPPEIIDCELCILGAGVAGLNALFAASRVLASTDEVVLIDRSPAPGGMWHTTYDYVRLHQPYPFFTAGNIPWVGQSARENLPGRGEVAAHLQRCFDTLSDRVALDARFETEYIRHEEPADASRPVEVHCNGKRGPLVVRARRLIKAFGYDIAPKKPFAFTSDAVRSTSPELFDISGPHVRFDDAPIFIVGGGKTGMDTAHTLIRHYPWKDVRMLVGAGTMFWCRDLAFPAGSRRYFGGVMGLDMLLDMASRFDGQNEHDVMAHFRRRYAVAIHEECRHFMFGLMSRWENAAIARGLTEVIRDHLEDVVDGPNGPTMTLRSGERRPVPRGSVFVNATGYLGGNRGHEPYLSPGGRVVSIQPSSAIHFLSSQASYFLSHLFLMDELAGLPFYELDWNGLLTTNRDTFAPVGMTLTLYNSLVAARALPRTVLEDNGLNGDQWYPKYRQIHSFLGLRRFFEKHPNHLRATLDAVRDRLGVRLGPLEATA